MATSASVLRQPPALAKGVEDRDPVLTSSRLAIAAVIVGAHVFIAIFLKTIPGLATAHAVISVGVGLLYAATTRRLRNIAIVAAYFTGCEVLWRMCKASVFWEFGKYSIAAVLLIALSRTRWTRNRGLAIAYFALLLPSIALTFSALELDAARQEISFYLAGPFVLTLAVIYFSNVKLTKGTLLAVFLALIAPGVGVGALSFLSTTAQDKLEFVNAANSFASGGFGPNQVAAMLGLAAMLLLRIVIEHRLSWGWRFAMFMLAIALATQATLTFSRGGIVLAFASLAGAAFFVFRGNRRARIAILFVTTLILALAHFVIEPKLEQLTEGELSTRYSNTTSSGRDRFISSELELFAESPILGVGPGIGMHVREERGLFYGASHTEYSRMLAEHGLFGAFALVCFVGLIVRAFRQNRTNSGRGHVTSMLIWSVLFMLVYGTRLGAPDFIFGLAFVRLPLPGRT